MAGQRRKPIDYTPELGARICELISNSQVGLRVILAQNTDLPAQSTIYKWRLDFPEFAKMYETARECQAELWLEDCLDIADDTAHDTIETEAGERANTEWINRSRLRVDTRLKIIEKMAPRKFGPKADLNLSGGLSVIFSSEDKGVL